MPLRREKAKLLVSTRYGVLGSWIGTRPSGNGNKVYVDYNPAARDTTDQLGCVFGRLPVATYPDDVDPDSQISDAQLIHGNAKGASKEVIWIMHDDTNYFLDGVKNASVAEVQRMQAKLQDAKTDLALTKNELAQSKAGYNAEIAGLKQKLALYEQRQERR